MVLLNKRQGRILFKLNLMPFPSIIFISTWMLIKTEVVLADFDYCTLGENHTMCIHKEEKVGTACGSNAQLSYATKEEKDVCVRIHNELRSEIATGKHTGQGCPEGSNILKLEWDDELEKVAHRMIMQCEFEHDFNRNVERFKCGQNLYSTSRSASPFPKGKEVYELGIRKWFSEIKDIDENNLKKFGSGHGYVGHFTQAIWCSSRYVGCALQNFVDSKGSYSTYVACNYGPAGNRKGQPVYEFGQMCSNCPDKHFCSGTYKGLCTDNSADKNKAADLRLGDRRHSSIMGYYTRREICIYFILMIHCILFRYHSIYI